MRIAIERGVIVAERTVANAKADPVLLRAAKTWGYTGVTTDAQAILNYVLERLLSIIVSQAKEDEGREARAASTINLDP